MRRPTPRLTRRLVAQSLCLLLGLSVLVAAINPIMARRSATLYPNLKTLPPSDLAFDTADIDGIEQHVLRFSNTIWNNGQGPLELVGNPKTGKLSQMLSHRRGKPSKRKVPKGAFVYHPQHDHWHFKDFARYELLKERRNKKHKMGRVLQRSTKTSFCIMDTYQYEELRGSPDTAVFDRCRQDVQGLSVGWGDAYAATLYDQWIILGDDILPDGDYVLRSVADPRNLLGEGGRRRNSEKNNKAVTCFSVVGGAISERDCS